MIHKYTKSECKNHKLRLRSQIWDTKTRIQYAKIRDWDAKSFRWPSREAVRLCWYTLPAKHGFNTDTDDIVAICNIWASLLLICCHTVSGLLIGRLDPRSTYTMTFLFFLSIYISTSKTKCYPLPSPPSSRFKYQISCSSVNRHLSFKGHHALSSHHIPLVRDFLNTGRQRCIFN